MVRKKTINFFTNISTVLHKTNVIINIIVLYTFSSKQRPLDLEDSNAVTKGRAEEQKTQQKQGDVTIVLKMYS